MHGSKPPSLAAPQSLRELRDRFVSYGHDPHSVEACTVLLTQLQEGSDSAHATAAEYYWYYA